MINLKNEIVFIRHSKIVENERLFGIKEAKASNIDIKKKLILEII